MKTTLELPDALVKKVKLRALHKGQKLKDTVVELLRIGFAADGKEAALAQPKIVEDKETGCWSSLADARRPARLGKK